MDILKTYFQSQGFSDDEVELISAKFHHKIFDKGELFVQEGKTSKHLGFVEYGFLQYFVNLDGEEKTTYTVGAGSFVASLVSYLRQEPSKENIRALVKSSVWMIAKDDYMQLQRDIPAFNAFYVGLLEWLICCIDESRLDAIMLTAQERYEKMLLKEPAVIQNIPLQYLASVLGITPRHLSRIRNNIR